MMNKAINILVLAMIDSLKKFKSKLAYYLAMFAMVFGSTVGTFNAANAVNLAASDIWADGISGANGTITDPSNNMAVDLKGFTLSAVTAGDGVNIGALTDTGANDGTDISFTIITTNGGGAVTQSLASMNVDGIVNILNIDNEDDMTVTLTGTGANTIGGALNLTSAEDTADKDILFNVQGSLTVTGITTLTAHTGSSASNSTLVVDKAATFTGGVVLDDNTGLAILEFQQGNAVAIAGNVTAAANNEGTIQLTGAGKTLSGDLGTSAKKLKEIEVGAASGNLTGTVYTTLLDVNAAVTLTGAVTVATATIDAATLVSGGLTGTTVTMGAGDVLTTTSDLTSALVVTDATSSILSSTTVNITGDINAAGSTDAGVIGITAGTTTFTGNLGAASGTNLITLNVATASRAVITETANFVDQIDMEGTGALEIAKTVTSGTVITAAGTTFAAADIPATSKIYMPVNLGTGETLVLLAGRNVDAISTAINLALVDTAVMDYVSANASGTHTITATQKSGSTAATELSVTKNEGQSIISAFAAVLDTTTDVAAETAIYNALTANGGLSATADTDLALQIAPQSDTTGGSAVATRAMTGTVQGIVSNRMASLRSGDAFATGMSAGNAMSANSGFIQAFGSSSEQKNTVKSGATTYGYDGETSGVAIGFDGMTEDGSTIGLSASYSTTDVDGKGTGKSKNSIDSYTVSVYADKATGVGYIEGSLTYGINDNTNSRSVKTAGLDRTYAGNFDSQQISLQVGGGVPKEVKDGTFVTPFISGTATQITSDKYTETSTTAADSLRLTVAQDDVTSLVGTVGVKAQMITDKGTPMISLSVNNEFGDTKISSQNTYKGGGTAFTTTTEIEELSATLGLGYSIGNDVTSLNLNYEANANEEDYLSHYGTVKIIAKF